MPRDATDLASLRQDPSLLATKASAARAWIAAGDGTTRAVTNPHARRCDLTGLRIF